MKDNKIKTERMQHIKLLSFKQEIEVQLQRTLLPPDHFPGIGSQVTVTLPEANELAYTTQPVIESTSFRLYNE